MEYLCLKIISPFCEIKGSEFRQVSIIPIQNSVGLQMNDYILSVPLEWGLFCLFVQWKKRGYNLDIFTFQMAFIGLQGCVPQRMKQQKWQQKLMSDTNQKPFLFSIDTAPKISFHFNSARRRQSHACALNTIKVNPDFQIEYIILYATCFFFKV